MSNARRAYLPSEMMEAMLKKEGDTMAVMRKTVTAVTGNFSFEAELIDLVTVTNDLVWGTFEAYTWKNIDEELEGYRKRMEDPRWTDLIRITRDESGIQVISCSVRTDTITDRRPA